MARQWRRWTIVSRRAARGAQWQSQRKRIQRDTERAKEKEGRGIANGGNRDGKENRERKRKREERESYRDRDPNNPSRSHRTELAEPSARARALLRTLLLLSRDQRSRRNTD